MTEKLDPDLVISCYNKFVAIRIKMAVANKKYRDTQHGKEKTRIIRNQWIENHKDDDEYRKKINLQAKIRYHRKKAIKMQEENNDISLGDSLGSNIEKNQQI